MVEHIPVMAREVLEGLAIRKNGTYWDGTFGRGGHSRKILDLLDENGRLLASDRDEQAEATAEAWDDPRFSFLRGDLERVVGQVPQGLSGLLWDLGCSTPQLKEAVRGFSFSENGPLDMRMDHNQEKTAEHIVNETDEEDLANLIYLYGEERFSRRLAARIVARREVAPITDTHTLADICRDVYPSRFHRIDPATRTFQALRIAVNDELGQLERSLPLALKRLATGGRAVLISFHSLEDRIVKHTFRGLAREGGYHIHTKRPLIACDDERNSNPASRSAKLRVIEKIEGDT